jgi:lysophospholipase L1-like esterase
VGGPSINITGATAGVSGLIDGTAVSFNGTTNYGVTAANINLTAYNKVVVEALVNFTNYDTSGTLMGWEFDTGQPGRFYFASKNGNSPNNKFTPALSGNTGFNYAQYTQASAGNWHHVVAIYDKGLATNEVNLYVDGVLLTAESRPLNLNNTNNFGNALMYLMSRSGSSMFSVGKMQHLAIYSDLSESKILAHAQASVMQFTAGVLSGYARATSSVLSWTNSTYGTVPIIQKLQRSPVGMNVWADVVNATTSPFIDSGLNPETQYDYRTVFTDASLNVVYSNVITITTNKLYPPYVANSDAVVVGPYDSAASGVANFGNASTHTSMDILTIGHKYRLRQNGDITSARLYTVNKTGLTGFYVNIYRLSGSTYTLVGQSNNLVDQLVAGDFSTVMFSSPITDVQEGDYYGVRIESPLGSGVYNFFARSSQTGVSAAYIYDEPSSLATSTWAGADVDGSVSGTVMPIELKMNAPQVVFIGDSIISGHNSHQSFLGTTETTNIASTIEYQFGNFTGYTYQNMGIGGQNTSQIQARFTNDVVNLHPRIVVIEGGVNDIAQGVSKATFIAKWTSILETAQASNGITTIFVLKILPWSNGTTVQMQTRDDWNSSLETLASGYSKAVVVDASSYVGLFRAGGDVANLWDMQAIYNVDGVHYNQAGHTKVAQALVDLLDNIPPVTSDNIDDVWHNSDVEINFSCDDSTGVGCASTFYTTDQSSPTINSSQGTNPTISADGIYTVKYFSTDAAGNQESIKTANNTVKLDKNAPSSVGYPSFGIISTSSIEIVVPAVVTEGGSGLYNWQARRNGEVELEANVIALATTTDLSLSENSQYEYDVRFTDNASNLGNFGATSSVYTLVDVPTNFSAVISKNSISLNVDSFPNDQEGLSSYLFVNETNSNSSDWIQTNSWQNTGLTCNTTYNYSVKYRNAEAVETDPITTSQKTSSCGSRRRTVENVDIATTTTVIDLVVSTSSEQSSTSSQLITVQATSTGLFFQGNDDTSKLIRLLISLGIIEEGKTEFINSIISSSHSLSFTFTKDLKFGQTDTEIMELQKFLNKNGFTVAGKGPGSMGNESNYFGIKTKEALKLFQKTNKISPVSGYFGSLTRGLVNNYSY